MDLHVVPGGIYRQQDNHVFRKTGVLEHTFGHYAVAEARASWFDFDGDGYRDLVMAVKFKTSPLRYLIDRIFGDESYKLDWKLFLYRNLHTDNHWLELQLRGSRGNPPAIGARVILEKPDGVVTEQVVGNVEGSHSSQGHYRVYFGLRESDTPCRVKVLWPDGRQQIVDPIPDELTKCFISRVSVHFMRT
jgi:ASPIC and UnbV